VVDPIRIVLFAEYPQFLHSRLSCSPHVVIDQLQELVLEAWARAVADGNFDDITEIPWRSPHEKVVGEENQIQYIVLAHSGRSGVAPNTIKAKIVAVADEIAVDGIFWGSLYRLME